MCAWGTSPPPLSSLELLQRLFCGGAEREQTRRPPQSHQPQCTTCFPITWQAPQRGSKFICHPEKKNKGQRKQQLLHASLRNFALCGAGGSRGWGQARHPAALPQFRPEWPGSPPLASPQLPTSPPSPIVPYPPFATHTSAFLLCPLSPALPAPLPSPSPLLLLVSWGWNLEAPAAQQEGVHTASLKEGGARGLKPGGLMKGLD